MSVTPRLTDRLMSKNTIVVVTKKVAKQKKARQLFRLAPSKRWKDDITNGTTPYPAHLMPKSKAKTLDADPKTRENYNPIGERGEHRHTPPQCVDFEDFIDRHTPDDVHRSSLVRARSGKGTTLDHAMWPTYAVFSGYAVEARTPRLRTI